MYDISRTSSGHLLDGFASWVKFSSIGFKRFFILLENNVDFHEIPGLVLWPMLIIQETYTLHPSTTFLLLAADAPYLIMAQVQIC